MVYPKILGRSLCGRHCEVRTGEDSQQEIRRLRRSVCTFAIISLYFRLRIYVILSRNANATIQCPVERGSYILEQTVALPKEIPKGKLLRNWLHVEILIFLIARFMVDVQGHTVEEDDMLCLKLRVDFMKPFPRLWWIPICTRLDIALGSSSVLPSQHTCPFYLVDVHENNMHLRITLWSCAIHCVYLICGPGPESLKPTFKESIFNAENLQEEKGQSHRFHGVLLFLRCYMAIQRVAPSAESKIKTRKREGPTKQCCRHIFQGAM